jgi:hypothetical protein
MSRVAIPFVLQSPSSGSAIAGATATITEHVVGDATPGTGTPASIYTQEVGGSALPDNQIVTDNLGRWTQGSGASYAPYWLPPGTYDMAISGPGLAGYVITRDMVPGWAAALIDDAGWVTWTQPTNWTPGTGAQAPAACVIGSIVFLRGYAINNTGGAAAYLPVSLPTIAIPSVDRQVNYAAIGSGAPGLNDLYITAATGKIQTNDATSPLTTNGNPLYFDGLCYSL